MILDENSNEDIINAHIELYIFSYDDNTEKTAIRIIGVTNTSIELYNLDVLWPVDLDGYSLEQWNPSTKKWENTTPFSGTINPHESLNLIKGTHFNFDINSKEDRIRIIKNNKTADTINYNLDNPMTNNQKWGLKDPFNFIYELITLEAPKSSLHKVLFINEIAGSGFDNDWVELYNSGDTDINLLGCKMYDSKGPDDEGNIFTEDKIVPSKGFVVLYKNTDFEFGISSWADSVTLLDKDGILIDSIEYEDVGMAADQTYGRFPDGGELITILTPTLGETNIKK